MRKFRKVKIKPKYMKIKKLIKIYSKKLMRLINKMSLLTLKKLNKIKIIH